MKPMLPPYSISLGTLAELGKSGAGCPGAALLTAIAQSAEELTSGKGWPAGVNDLLAALGKATRVSRVWIFQTINVTRTLITQNYTFEWAQKRQYRQIGMPMFNMFTNNVERPGYKELIESRTRGEWQKVLVSKLQDGWLKDTLGVQKIKSMLTIPIMVEGKWWGTLGLDDCEREYDWTEAEIALLRIAAFLISNAVMRDQLSATRKQFNIFKRLTDSNVWQYNFESNHLWCSSDIIHTIPGPTENLSFSLRETFRFIHPHDRRGLRSALRSFFANPKGVFRHDLRVLTDCGGIRWVELIGNLSVREDGTFEQFAGIAVDIRSRKQEEERLRTQAGTDPLTGVMNRRRFEQELRKHIDKRTDRTYEFTLLLLDLDRFKSLNDTHGHVVGDEVLKHFVAICQKSLRQEDVFARLGGDEFAIILPNVNSEAAKNIGDRIRIHVAETPLITSNASIKITCSVGCAARPDSLSTTQNLIGQADAALYEAKQTGRNKVVMQIDTCQ